MLRRARRGDRHGHGPARGARRARGAPGGGRVELLDRVACVVKSPGVPNEAPVIVAARERGLPVHGRARAGLAAPAATASSRSPGRTARPPRPSCSARSGARPACRWRWRATSARRSPRWSATLDAGRDGRVRGVELPGRGLDRVRARHRPAAQPQRGPPRPARQLRGLPRRQAAHVRAAGPEQVAVAPPGRSCRGGAADRVRRPGRAAAAGRRRSACAGAHNLENAWGRRGGARVRRAGRGRGRRACARFAGRAAPARGGGRGRRRAVRERLQGHQRVGGGARDRVLRRRGARDPRRQPQGRRLRGAARARWRRAAGPAT